MKKIFHVIGLMSGSSLDGLDIAFVRMETERGDRGFTVENWSFIDASTYPFPGDWKERLRQLPDGTACDLAKTHAAFGKLMGEMVNRFFEEKGIAKGQVDLVASHGHTVFHEPSRGFTTQIGDGAALAATTGCTVVCDFRSADIARGGQGAPLAPVADKYLFPGYDLYLNLGGIANLSCQTGDRFIAFDICGANQILNALANRLGFPYDENGKVAASGTLIPYLIRSQLELPFFQQSYPKSLSNQWVQHNQVAQFLNNPHVGENLLHTACELIGQLVGASVQAVTERELPEKEAFRMLVTGGGAHNGFLMSRIMDHCKSRRVECILPEPEVVDYKEALLMALMGVMRMEGVPNVMSSVTGAETSAIGGTIFA